MENLNQLKKLVESVNVDFEKSIKGNKAAGVRARKTLLEIQRLCKPLRAEVMDHRAKDND